MLEGSSKYFLGSFVTYSNELKQNILNVSKKTLEENGAVSIETVKEMIKGLPFRQFLKSGLSDKKMIDIRDDYFISPEEISTE